MTVLAGLERFWHDILRAVQPAMRLLSELEHQSEEEGLGVGRRGDRRSHAQAAGRDKVPQRQLRHAGARRAAGKLKSRFQDGLAKKTPVLNISSNPYTYGMLYSSRFNYTRPRCMFIYIIYARFVENFRN